MLEVPCICLGRIPAQVCMHLCCSYRWNVRENLSRYLMQNMIKFMQAKERWPPCPLLTSSTACASAEAIHSGKLISRSWLSAD